MLPLRFNTIPSAATASSGEKARRGAWLPHGDIGLIIDACPSACNPRRVRGVAFCLERGPGAC